MFLKVSILLLVEIRDGIIYSLINLFFQPKWSSLNWNTLPNLLGIFLHRNGSPSLHTFFMSCNSKLCKSSWFCLTIHILGLQSITDCILMKKVKNVMILKVIMMVIMMMMMMIFLIHFHRSKNRQVCLTFCSSFWVTSWFMVSYTLSNTVNSVEVT